MTSSTRQSHPSSDGGVITLPFFLLFMALPYLIGLYGSSRHLTVVQDVLDPWLLPLPLTGTGAGANPVSVNRRTSVPMKDLDNCYQRLVVKMHRGRDKKHQDDPFADLSIVVHRNGEIVPCGNTTSTTAAAASSDSDSDTKININIMRELKSVLENMNECPTDFGDKYQVEALLTRLLHQILMTATATDDAKQTQCPSQETDRSASLGFYGYCDMGPSKTPILKDHDKLVPIIYDTSGNGGNSDSGSDSETDSSSSSSSSMFLPCHFHIRSGQRVTSLSHFAQLARHAIAPSSSSKEECASDDDEDGQETCTTTTTTTTTTTRELHLYAVPAGRVFMFAPSHVGEIIHLPHVTGAGHPPHHQPVYLQVLSVSPRVFDLVNFFSKAESATIVERALDETSESHRIKRSSTGAVGYTVNSGRTSESGFDTNGPTAMALKKRCFDVLGFDEYMEDHADGLQILRYNLTKAYTAHSDWIDGSPEVEHDHDSAGVGGNRFATILLYMSDLGPGEGGETVFTEAWPIGQAKEDRIDTNKALRQLRDSDQGMVLKQGSWEEKMVAKCRSRLAVRSTSGRAVLFYSQLPNGEEDKASMHGGCPVLSGQKWAANLWVWSTPRQGYPGNPKNPNFKHTAKSRKASEVTDTGGGVWKKVSAIFGNKEADPKFDNAELYFENTFWAKMGPSDPPIAVDTFKSHVWNVRVDGKVVHTWTITSDEEEKQYFSI